MKHSKNRTALMVFSLSAAQEASRKQVFGKFQKKSSTDLFQYFINNTSQLAEKSGLDVIWFGEKEQRGQNFATRFSNAYQQLFDQGYDRVIAIGNDCPNLHPSNIKNAVEQFQAHDLVLGPAYDGGVYLMGVTKTAFDRETFEQLPWQEKELFHSLETWAKNGKLRFYSFELLKDIDSYQDVIFLATECPNTFLGALIWKILKGICNSFKKEENPIFFEYHHSLLPLRAPPFPSHQ